MAFLCAMRCFDGIRLIRDLRSWQPLRPLHLFPATEVRDRISADTGQWTARKLANGTTTALGRRDQHKSSRTRCRVVRSDASMR